MEPVFCIRCLNLGRLCDSCYKIVGRLALSEQGRKGGSVKSAKKAKSSRENGKLGGRPRKTV